MHPLIGTSTHKSFYPPNHSPIHSPTHLSIHPPTHPLTNSPTHPPFIHLSIHVLRQSIYLLTHPSTHSPMFPHPSIHPSIYSPFPHPFILYKCPFTHSYFLIPISVFLPHPLGISNLVLDSKITLFHWIPWERNHVLAG